MPSLSRFLLLAVLAAASGALHFRKAPDGGEPETPVGRRSSSSLDLVEAAVQGARARGALEGMSDEEARGIARNVLPIQEVRVLRNPIVDTLLTMDERSVKGAFSPVGPARRLQASFIENIRRLEWFLWSVPGALLLAGAALLLIGRNGDVAALARMGELYCWGWLTLLCAVVAATGWVAGTDPWEEIPLFFWRAPFLLWMTCGALALYTAHPGRAPLPRHVPRAPEEFLGADLSPTFTSRVGEKVDRFLERWLG